MSLAIGQPALLFPDPAHPDMTRIYRDPPAMTVSIPSVLVEPGAPRALVRIRTSNIMDRVSVWVSEASGIPAGLVLTTQVHVSMFDSSNLTEPVATIAKALQGLATVNPWVLQVSGVRGCVVELWAGTNTVAHRVSWTVLVDRSHCCTRTVIS